MEVRSYLGVKPTWNHPCIKRNYCHHFRARTWRKLLLALQALSVQIWTWTGLTSLALLHPWEAHPWLLSTGGSSERPKHELPIPRGAVLSCWQVIYLGSPKAETASILPCHAVLLWWPSLDTSCASALGTRFQCLGKPLLGPGKDLLSSSCHLWQIPEIKYILYSHCTTHNLQLSFLQNTDLGLSEQWKTKKH